MINAIHIALSGLLASQSRAGASASNIANMTTSGSLTDSENPPYKAVTTVQEAVAGGGSGPGETGGGVRAAVVPARTPFVPAYSPDSPFADERGMIGVPNVDLAAEAVNLNLAEISFRANFKVIEKANEMTDALLRSFDRKV